MARALVAASLLWTAAGGWKLRPWDSLVPVLFLAFSVAVVAAAKVRRASLALPRFLLDVLFFTLACAFSPASGSAWLVSLFYLYLLSAAALLHSWREVLLAAAAAAVVAALQPPASRAASWTFLLLGGLPALLLSLEKRALESRLADGLRRVAIAEAECARSEQQERQKIAADFHDGPLQSFISFQMRLELIRKLLERDLDAARSELRQLQDLLRSQVSDLRGFIRAMRSSGPEPGGLATSIRRLVEAFQKDTGIAASFLGQIDGPAEPEVPLELLQIVREALTNVQKHSRATRVAVAASKADDSIEISVEDDGAGYPFAGAFTIDELESLRLGPASIMQRVRHLGGELSLDSRPGHGSSLKVRVPA